VRGIPLTSISERCKSLILIYICIKCDSYGKAKKDYLSPLTIGEDQEKVRGRPRLMGGWLSEIGR
jgi:hypothetical protein